MKNLLFFAVLLLFANCSSHKIDLNKITGSWYFVEYADKPYSKSELKDYSDAEIQQSPTGKIKNFHYIFNGDGTYEYIIYNNLIDKGKYTINHQDNLIVLHKTAPEKDTLKVKYLDNKYLQVINNETTDRIYIYYKTNYKFPAVEEIPID